MKPLNVDDLVQGYLSGKSVKQLARESGAGAWTIKARLLERGVKLRTGSETAKLFNRGPEGPKVAVSSLAASAMVEAYVAGEPPNRIAARSGFGRAIVYRELTKAGVLRGCSDAARLRWERMTDEERSAVVTPAHRANTGRKQRPENLARAAATRQRRLTFAFPSETALVESLRGIGYTILPQRAVGPYNLDAALEECRVSVEVQTGGPAGFLTSPHGRERLKYLFDQGWSVLFVVVRKCGFAFPDVTQKVLAFAEVAGRGKPYFRQYGMVRSDGKDLTRPRTDLDCRSRVPGF